nr:interleukin 17-1 [Sepiella japonica]
MKAFIAGFTALCVIITLVHSASLKCRNPTNLEKMYNDYQVNNKLPLQVNDTASAKHKICQNNRMNISKNCPKTQKVITDESLFPARRNHVICLCRDCSDSLQLNDCVHIYEEKLVLQRTNTCKNGVYDYVPKNITIAVDCQCMKKIIYNFNSNQYDL